MRRVTFVQYWYNNKEYYSLHYPWPKILLNFKLITFFLLNLNYDWIKRMDTRPSTRIKTIPQLRTTKLTHIRYFSREREFVPTSQSKTRSDTVMTHFPPVEELVTHLHNFGILCGNTENGLCFCKIKIFKIEAIFCSENYLFQCMEFSKIYVWTKKMWALQLYDIMVFYFQSKSEYCPVDVDVCENN